MDDGLLLRLSASILSLVPDFPVSAEEIQAAIKARGLDGFINGAGRHAAALAEIAGLLGRPGKGGAEHGDG
jgi:hypothetical protein